MVQWLARAAAASLLVVAMAPAAEAARRAAAPRPPAAGLLQQSAASPVLRQRFRQWLATQLTRPAPLPAGGAASAGMLDKLAVPQPAMPPQQHWTGVTAKPIINVQVVNGMVFSSPLDDTRLLHVGTCLELAQELGLPAGEYFRTSFDALQMARSVCEELRIHDHPMTSWATQEVDDMVGDFKVSAISAAAKAKPEGSRLGFADLPLADPDDAQRLAEEAVLRSYKFLVRVGVLRELDTIKAHVTKAIGAAAIHQGVWSALYQRLARTEQGHRLSRGLRELETVMDLVIEGEELDAKQWRRKLLGVLMLLRRGA